MDGFVMEKPIKMDDGGEVITLFFWKHPICPGKKKPGDEDLIVTVSSTRLNLKTPWKCQGIPVTTTSERPVTWAPGPQMSIHIPPQQKRMAGYSKRPFLKRDTFIHTFYKPSFWVSILNFKCVQPRLRRSHKIQSRWDEQHFLLQLDNLRGKEQTIHCALATRQEATLEIRCRNYYLDFLKNTVIYVESTTTNPS